MSAQRGPSPAAELQAYLTEPGAESAARDGAAPDRLLRRLPVGVVAVDSGLRVEYVNPAAAAFLGPVSVGALLPDPWPVFSLRKFATRLFADVPSPRVVDMGDGRLLELEGIAPAGAEPALLVLQDVTARERHARAEREFAANAAHELRTPIAAIVSAVEVLQDGAKEDVGQRDLFLGHLERESVRLVRLADALLLLAQIQGGDGGPSLRVVEVRPLLEEVAAELDVTADVTVRTSCARGVSVLADHGLLNQAVLNLAKNAARHTTAGEIELAARMLGPVCELQVRDTGAGMTRFQQERVFDRFFRGDGGGFGLGLAITREITRALGGTVELDSVPGDGTIVRLRLPAARVVHE